MNHSLMYNNSTGPLVHDVISRFHLYVQEAYSKGYETPYEFLCSPSRSSAIEEIAFLADTKRAHNPVAVFVIGIGGSFLGTKAVYEALQETSGDLIPLYFIDTFDVYALKKAEALIKSAASLDQNVLVVTVTKSGTTAETIVNFIYLLDVLETAYPQKWKELVVIISDQKSSLSEWSCKYTSSTLFIPSQVGGRFSVLTAVGLFPLALSGIDIKELCKGADTYTQYVLSSSDNPSATSALFVYQQYQKGCSVYDLFLFDKRLESWGKWYRQLLAESIGKQKEDMSTVAIIPTVSIGTLELHSVAQLMLGAHPRVITTFITVAHVDDISLAPTHFSLGAEYEGTTVHTRMNKAAHATQKAYDLVGLSYDHLVIPEITPFYVGQLLQMYMIQVVYLAALCEVNAFDQPHVELYKNIMRTL